MNTSHLPYVIAIASTGSLSAASRQLGISQPALTKHLKKLEEEAGMDLFFRSRKKYIPTPAGRLYLQTAQSIIEQMHHARSAIAALGSAALPPLRLGVSPNRGVEIMSKIYPSFDKRYPQQPLSLREGYANDLRDLLLQNQLDLVISTHNSEAPEGLEVMRSHSEEMVLAVPAFHPAVQHQTFVWDELPYADLHAFRDFPFVLPTPSSSQYELDQTIFTEAHFQPQLTVSCSNAVLQEALVRSGTHVAFLPAFYVHPNKEIAYFRLHTSARLMLAFLTRAGHVFSEPERYLIYLWVKCNLEGDGRTILWNDLLRGPMREFDPLVTARQELEGKA